MSSAEQPPAGGVVTPQLDPVQEQLVEATLVAMGASVAPPPPPPPPPMPIPTPPAQPATFAGDIRELVTTGTLTIPDLEAFLSANCRWYYSGGYAAFLWAQEDNLSPVQTNDLDILVEPGKEAMLRQMMFGEQGASGSTTAGPYKVSLFEADEGAFANRTQLGSAWVLNRENLSGRYKLNADLIGARKLKKTDSPHRIEPGEPSTDQAPQIDADKLERRRRRVENLDAGSIKSKEKETEDDNG